MSTQPSTLSRSALGLEAGKPPIPRQPKYRKLAALFRETAPQLLFFVMLAGVWEAMARALNSPLVPGVEAIGHQLFLIIESSAAFRDIGITFARMTLGFLLALVLALPLGMLSGTSRTAERFLEPGVVLGLTVPGLVWALLCVIWFGVSLASSVIAVALGVLPSLVITVQHAVRSLGSDTHEMLRVFRVPSGTIIRKVWLPLLYSFTISGCRVGFSIAWKVIVLVEIFGMSNGVGYALNSAFSVQNVEAVLAWTLAFWATMLLVEHGVFRPLERHASHWKKEVKA